MQAYAIEKARIEATKKGHRFAETATARTARQTHHHAPFLKELFDGEGDIVTVGPAGETTVQTHGYTGPACKDASRFIEEAIGENDRRAAHPRVSPTANHHQNRTSPRKLTRKIPHESCQTQATRAHRCLLPRIWIQTFEHDDADAEISPPVPRPGVDARDVGCGPRLDFQRSRRGTADRSAIPIRWPCFGHCPAWPPTERRCSSCGTFTGSLAARRWCRHSTRRSRGESPPQLRGGPFAGRRDPG